jgi:hypothetical protein
MQCSSQGAIKTLTVKGVDERGAAGGASLLHCNVQHPLASVDHGASFEEVLSRPQPIRITKPGCLRGYVGDIMTNNASTNTELSKPTERPMDDNGEGQLGTRS